MGGQVFYSTNPSSHKKEDCQLDYSKIKTYVSKKTLKLKTNDRMKMFATCVIERNELLKKKKKAVGKRGIIQ